MGINICELSENRLVDRLRSLKVKGEVIEKKGMESFGGRPDRKTVVVKFKNRIVETNLDDSEFESTEIGGQIWFSPPVPVRDPCNCHLFVWMTVGLVAGALAIWTIASYFQGKTAFLLSLVAAAGVSVIAWARICSHEQNKYFRDLEMEIDFFITDGDHEQGDRE